MSRKTYFISTDVENVLDPKVYNDVLKMHAKESITLFDFGMASITTVENKLLEKVQFTECEIVPFHSHDIVCKSEGMSSFGRKGSVRSFSEKPLSFSTLQTMLIQSFSPDRNGRRPYPSGGGLYTVEPLVFLFSNRLVSDEPVISGCYHFRPISRTLQLVKKLSCDHFFNKLLHGMIKEDERPACAILYVTPVGKTIFKYRYRGYRHAVMEVGSMYQEVTRVSQELGLSSTVYSSFSEHEFLYSLGLDSGAFLPLTMQLFGYS